MIHSVDRLSLAKEIDRQWSKLDKPVDILIQVNLGEEETKSGTDEAALQDLVRQVAAAAQRADPRPDGAATLSG